MESGTTPPAGGPSSRIPRGAIAVVVIGLLATVAAALLSSGKGEGEAAHLEWVQHRTVPDSKPVAVPGSTSAMMQLVDGKIQVTGTNFSNYFLFRVLTTLQIDKGAPIGEGKILCTIHATRRSSEIAQSSGGLRMTYPRSSESGIYGQPISETVTANFASHGYELAILEVNDLKQPRFTSIQGVKVEWPEFEEGTEHIEYELPAGDAKATIKLPFYTIWRTQEPAEAKVSCRLETAAGKATATTVASLPHVPPPIDEEAEEEKLEEREENGEEAGEKEAEEEAEGE